MVNSVIRGPDIYIGGQPKKATKPTKMHNPKHHGFDSATADRINAEQMRKFQRKVAGTVTKNRGAGQT